MSSRQSFINAANDRGTEEGEESAEEIFGVIWNEYDLKELQNLERTIGRGETPRYVHEPIWSDFSEKRVEDLLDDAEAESPRGMGNLLDEIVAEYEEAASDAFWDALHTKLVDEINQAIDRQID